MSPEPRGVCPGYRVESVSFGECSERVRAFRNAHREISRSESYFRWRYAEKPVPAGTSPAFITWVIDARGEDVAATSVIPHRYLLGGCEAVLGLLGDISVHPAHQGKGLATHLLKSAQSEAALRRLDGCLVLPNVEVEGALRRSGFRRVGAIQRYMFPLSPLRRVLPLPSALARWSAMPWTLLLRAVLRGASGTDCRTGESPGLHPGLDDLWVRTNTAGLAMATRDAAAWNWRFASKPDASHRFHHLEESGRLQAFCASHEEVGCLCIDDLLCSSPESGTRLLCRLLLEFAAEGRLHAAQWRSSAPGLRCQASPMWPWSRRPDEQAVMFLGFGNHQEIPALSWIVTPADKDV